MKKYVLDSSKGLDGLQFVDAPTPEPAPGEVLIRIRANSLNFRDLLMTKGGYPRNSMSPVVPVSDAAGEVIRIGAAVTGFKAGDRVALNFMRDWAGGQLNEAVLHSAYGGAIDGLLAEYVTAPAHAVVHIPAHLSYAEAATLPCAAVTAWNALVSANLRAGETVLLLGTGGVSIFGLQFAKAFGARAIVTSSSDDKLAKARALGADEAINYTRHPEWHTEVLRLTGGVGVDNVLEVGGSGTLERSLKAVRVGGTISLIGLLAQAELQPSVLPALLNAQTIRGIYVGSTEMFRSMNAAISANGIRPVIDRTFRFTEARAAYEYFAGQQHTGKVVISQE